jgi:hypothetical protein
LVCALDAVEVGGDHNCISWGITSMFGASPV